MAKPDHFTGKLLVDKSYVEASGFPAFQLFSTGEKALTSKPQTKLKGDRDTDSTDGQKLINKKIWASQVVLVVKKPPVNAEDIKKKKRIKSLE